jgi:hypothetical protein
MPTIRGAVYAHINLIARDWMSLAAFYEQVFGCEPVPPERDLSGPWLDAATGLPGAHLRGMHLIPSCGQKENSHRQDAKRAKKGWYLIDTAVGKPLVGTRCRARLELPPNHRFRWLRTANADSLPARSHPAFRDPHFLAVLASWR